MSNPRTPPRSVRHPRSEAWRGGVVRIRGLVDRLARVGDQLPGLLRNHWHRTGLSRSSPEPPCRLRHRDRARYMTCVLCGAGADLPTPPSCPAHRASSLGALLLSDPTRRATCRTSYQAGAVPDSNPSLGVLYPLDILVDWKVYVGEVAQEGATRKEVHHDLETMAGLAPASWWYLALHRSLGFGYEL